MKTWKRFCPLMKGTCCDGFVKGMPVSDEGEQTKCAFFITLVGKDPQSEESINDPGCSIAFMPVIQLEGNQHTRQVAASADKVATEVRHGHASFIGALTDDARERLIKNAPKVDQVITELEGPNAQKKLS